MFQFTVRGKTLTRYQSMNDRKITALKLMNPHIPSFDTSKSNSSLIDEVDAWAIRKPKYAEEPENTITKIDLDPQSEVYNMNHKRRGLAIIFNHVHFRRILNRNGGEKDSDNLAKTLMYLGFDVHVHIDPSLDKIMTILESAANEDHTDADCLVVAAMSYGQSGYLQAYENLYPVDILWNSFSSCRCPTLAGKPKIFFIQACCGTRIPHVRHTHIGHEMNRMSSYGFPNEADIVIAYSSLEGSPSWRNVDTGSWFISALCEELKENWRTRDLLRMLTAVVRRIVMEYSPRFSQEYRKDMQQLPAIVSMLTRLVYFTEKAPESPIDEKKINAGV